MEWSERMNAAINYIEENLAGEIDFNKTAEKAACSTFHFQRVFFAINGLTPAEYARRRKLTLAATELSSSNAKVIDIATKYGYDSPNAFARAFRKLHGITPQAAREPGVTLTAFPRISFHIALKGGNDMDYKIIQKPAFDVIGRARKFTNVNGENLIKIPQFWEEFTQTDDFKVLLNLNQGKCGPITGGQNLGVCVPGETIEVFTYAIAVEKPEEANTVGFDIIHIPAATWGLFETTLDDISKCWRQIFEEWLPSTGYEYAAKPDLEVYLPGDMSPDSKCQIWIPVDKKK